MSVPCRIDAAGMELSASLRHFDRGSQKVDSFHTKEYVFGGTGACIMFRRSAVESLLLEGPLYEKDKYRVHPDLAYKPEARVPFFDEAFFAYREDADLAWRSQLLGIKCLFEPRSIAYHRRVVLPSNRSTLPPELNGYSVRNRFLMQMNNYFFSNSLYSLLVGIVLRNFVVILGVLFTEPSSIKYLKQVWGLRRRALERRAIMRERQISPQGII